MPVISSATLLTIIEPSYSQEQAQGTGDCPANPQISVTTCTEKITINLRALESFNEDRFKKRYEPDPGYKIVGHSVNQIGKTGDSSYPSVNKVQAGNTLATGQQIQTAQKDISEITSKLSGEVKDPRGFAKASAEITNKANSELSQINNFVSTQTTSNHGLDIEARAAAICKQKNPFKAGSCAIWGPGGSVAAEVIVNLVYVGTPSDVQAIAQKYIAELNKAAEQAKQSVPPEPNQPEPNQPGGTLDGAWNLNWKIDEVPHVGTLSMKGETGKLTVTTTSSNGKQIRVEQTIQLETKGDGTQVLSGSDPIFVRSKAPADEVYAPDTFELKKSRKVKNLYTGTACGEENEQGESDCVPVTMRLAR
jgi:hypothetical protein